MSDPTILQNAIVEACSPKTLIENGEGDLETNSMMLTNYIVVAEWIDEHGSTWLTQERTPGMTPWLFRGLLAQAIATVPPYTRIDGDS